MRIIKLNNIKLSLFMILVILGINFVLADSAADDYFNANASFTTRINLTANDVGTDIIVGSITQPSHGTVVNNYDGTVNYTSEIAFMGADYFTYELTTSGNKAYGNHYYEYIADSGIIWSDANSSASIRTLNGMQGYLVTVTSSGENDFIKQKLNGNSWMGATDEGHDKIWKWVTGPEEGMIFFYQNPKSPADPSAAGCGAGGTVAPGNYSNWAAEEPNDWSNGCANGENYAHFYANDGSWNDYAGTNTNIDGYVVEYGGMAGDTPVIYNATVYITVYDTSAPLLTIISPTATTYTTSTIKFNISGSENLSSCKYSIDNWLNNVTMNSLNTTYYFNTTSINDGSYIGKFWCNDTSGNINNTKTVSFSVDTSGPIITIYSPTSQTYDYYIDNVKLNVTANENVNKWWYSLNNGVNTTFTPNSTITGIMTNNYTLKIYANDSYGNLGSNNVSFNVSIPDSDNDGIYDINDTLRGNATNVTTTGIINLNVTIGGEPANSSYDNVHQVVFYDGAEKLVNFTHNFTANELDFARVTITLTDIYILINLSGQLQDNYNKTAYLANNNFVSFCVKDSEINSASEITAGCTDTANNETDFTTCLGNSIGVTINNITCKEVTGIIEVSNLRHSALKGTQASSSSSSSGGGGGGNKITPTNTCISSWNCTQWSSCINTHTKRTCEDSNQCKISINTPEIEMICDTENRPIIDQRNADLSIKSIAPQDSKGDLDKNVQEQSNSRLKEENNSSLNIKNKTSKNKTIYYMIIILTAFVLFLIILFIKRRKRDKT